MKKKDYKYLVCAITLATTVSFSSGIASADMLDTNMPAAKGVTLDLSTGKTVNNVTEGTLEMPDEESAVAEAEPDQAKPMTRTDEWNSTKPSDQQVLDQVQAIEGKTIVDIQFEGVSEDVMRTITTAQVSKAGDTCTMDLLAADARSFYATGYFYDMYPSFTEVPEGVAVTYHLFETPVLTSVELVGNTQIEPTAKLLGKMQLKPGDRLNRLALKEDLNALQKQYVKDGYIMAKINEMEVGDDGKLLIRINEGLLEGYKIKGLKKTKEKVVLRELRTKVGEPLNKKDVERSYQRLTNLNYFESVDVKPIPGVEPNACVLEVDVTEKNTGVFGIGAGYSNSDGFVGMISLGDNNFRGVGDSINLTLIKGGGKSSSRGFTLSYRRPWLDKRETAGMIRIFNRTFAYNDYDENGDFKEEYMKKTAGFELGFSRPQSEYSTNSITIRHKKDSYVEHVESGNVGDRSQPWAEAWRKDNFGTTRSIIFTHATDTRDNYIYPTKGHRAVLGYEYTGLGGDFRYQKFTIEDSKFWPVGRNQVLVAHGSYGHATSQLPESAQFMLGGQNTIRGYRDDCFRGNSMVLGNIEFRFPLAKKFKGAIFTDFGSAWDHGWKPSKLHGSYGVGIMLDSPLGLIRVDIGHGTQGNRVHFNVGGTF